jgi:hypothetical protein
MNIYNWQLDWPILLSPPVNTKHAGTLAGSQGKPPTHSVFDLRYAACCCSNSRSALRVKLTFDCSCLRCVENQPLQPRWEPLHARHVMFYNRALVYGRYLKPPKCYQIFANKCLFRLVRLRLTAVEPARNTEYISRSFLMPGYSACRWRHWSQLFRRPVLRFLWPFLCFKRDLGYVGS